MRNPPLELGEQARYIGSLLKNDEMCDFYEVIEEGNTRYVYVAVGSEDTQGVTGVKGDQ